MKKQKTIKVDDLLNTKGFFRPMTSPLNTAAILRGEQTAITVEGNIHVNKGDFIVFNPVKGNGWEADIGSFINQKVYEVTFVAPVQHTDPIRQMVCFRECKDFAFEEGDLGGEYQEDTLVYLGNEEE